MHFFQPLIPFLYLKCTHAVYHLSRLMYDVVVVNDTWLTALAPHQLDHVTPTVDEVMLVTNFLTAVWLLSSSASGTRKSICLPAHNKDMLLYSVICNQLFFLIWYVLVHSFPAPHLGPSSAFCWFRDKVTTGTVDVSESSSCGRWAVISHDAWSQN